MPVDMNDLRGVDETIHQSGSKPPWRQVLALAIPLVASNACETIMMVSDRWILAQIDPVLMSATMAAHLTAFTIMTPILGLLGYVTALIAQHKGAGESQRIGQVLGQGLWLALLAYPWSCWLHRLGLGCSTRCLRRRSNSPRSSAVIIY